MSCAFSGPTEKESIYYKLYTCKAWSQCGESSVVLDDWSYKSLSHSDHTASDCLYLIEMEPLRLQKRAMLFAYTCRWVTYFCNCVENQMKSSRKNLLLHCYTSSPFKRKITLSHFKHGLYRHQTFLFNGYSRTFHLHLNLTKSVKSQDITPTFVCWIPLFRAFKGQFSSTCIQAISPLFHSDYN